MGEITTDDIVRAVEWSLDKNDGMLIKREQWDALTELNRRLLMFVAAVDRNQQATIDGDRRAFKASVQAIRAARAAIANDEVERLLRRAGFLPPDEAAPAPEETSAAVR